MGKNYGLRPLSQAFSSAIPFFQGTDEVFREYLDVKHAACREDAEAEIQRLLSREADGGHLYYVIQNPFGETIGLFYLYGYERTYHRCNLAIGLSASYRGQGLAGQILMDVSEELLSRGFVRVGLEVETTNESSLRCVKKLCERGGLIKEGVLHNLYGKNIDCVVFAWTMC